MMWCGRRDLNPRSPAWKASSEYQSCNMVYHSDGSSDKRVKSGKLIKPAEPEFRQWLAKKVTERTLRDLMSYFGKLPKVIEYSRVPKLVKNKWYASVLSKIAQFLWETGRIGIEDRERIKALVRGSVKRGDRRVHTPEVKAGDVASSIKSVSRVDYRLVYEVMGYSGGRLKEACYLLNNSHRFRAVDLGEAVRVVMGYNRGFKRCEYLYLPKELWLRIRAGKWNVSAKNVTTYARKNKLILPKLVRKFHYQVMEDLGVDKEVRAFIQNRYSEITVSDEAYSKLVTRADQAYVNKILPRLQETLERASRLCW